jgi:hypothetical protein
MLYHDGRPWEQTMTGAEVAMWACRVWGRVWSLPHREGTLGTLVMVNHEGGRSYGVYAVWPTGEGYQASGWTLQACYRWLHGLAREEQGSFFGDGPA